MTKRLPVDYNDLIHEYRVNGQILESVTEALPFISGASMDRILNKQEIGKEVHAGVENDVKHSLITTHHDPVVDGYMASWLRGKIELGLRPAVDFDGQPICERIVFHPLYNYAGRIDLVAYSERLGIPPNEPCMVDIKTVAVLSAMTALQDAAYLEAYNYYYRGKAPLCRHRAALRLKPDGSLPEFRVYPASEQKKDFAAFLNMLGTYRWFKEKYKNPPAWEEIVGAWMEQWTPPETAGEVKF